MSCPLHSLVSALPKCQAVPAMCVCAFVFWAQWKSKNSQVCWLSCSQFSLSTTSSFVLLITFHTVIFIVCSHFMCFIIRPVNLYNRLVMKPRGFLLFFLFFIFRPAFYLSNLVLWVKRLEWRDTLSLCLGPVYLWNWIVCVCVCCFANFNAKAP